MSQDKTVFRRIKRRIDSTRKNLAELGEITAKKDLLNIIMGMGDLLEANGFAQFKISKVESGWKINIKPLFKKEIIALFSNIYPENKEYLKIRKKTTSIKDKNIKSFFSLFFEKIFRLLSVISFIKISSLLKLRDK